MDRSGSKKEDQDGGVKENEARKVLFIASIGNFLDFYDFFISSSAASLVWPTIFIQPIVAGNTNLALAISLASFGITFLARPLGAFIFGHYGDRVGRRSALLITLLLAFISMVGIGLLPPYASIGVIAVILLFIFRFILGISFGGEWGGGATWIMEFAYKRGKLGLYSAIYQISGQFGITTSSLAFATLAFLLPRQQLLDWGWRVLFYIGAVVLIIGAIIRYLFTDSPVFERIKSQNQVAKYPAAEVFRIYPGKILLLAGSWFYIPVIAAGISKTFSLGYINAISKGPIGGLPTATAATLGVAIAEIVSSLTVVLGSGIILDRLKPSPKVFFYVSAIASAIAMPVFFILVNSLDLVTIFLAYIMIQASTIPPTGILAYWYTKEFPAKYRSSGSGLAYNFGGLFGGIVTTFILPFAVALAPSTRESWPYVSIVGSVAALVSMACVLLVRETRGEEKELYER